MQTAWREGKGKRKGAKLVITNHKAWIVEFWGG
jgi:hypothetical protein